MVRIQDQFLFVRNRQVYRERQLVENNQFSVVFHRMGQNTRSAMEVGIAVRVVFQAIIGDLRAAVRPRAQLAAGDDEAIDVDGCAVGHELTAVDDEVDVSADAGTGITNNCHSTGIEDDRSRGFVIIRTKDGFRDAINP